MYEPVTIKSKAAQATSEHHMPQAPDVQAAQGEGKKPGTANKRQIIEDALSYFYEFRRNTMTKIPEYRDIGNGDFNWQRMTDDDLNSIERRLQLAGYAASESLVWKIIRSDYAPAFHPVKDYFLGLEKWDGTDHIRAISKTVRCVGIENALFDKYLRKWLVASVANVFIDNYCANHLCFVLAGSQGAFKSTWIRNLYPEAIKDYCMEGGLDPDNKDSIIRAAENFIINMDDYFADVSARKVNSLKGFITHPVIKIRRPYGRVDEVMPKICSFIGSTNEAQFLYDDTGDRRFVCFEVEHINMEAAKKININQVYAQALYLFRNKYTYWIDKTEEAEHQELNSRFRVQSHEYEMCYRYLRIPAEDDQGEFMTTSQIANYLGGFTKVILSLKRIGQSLKLQGYERKSVRMGQICAYGYHVVKPDLNNS